MDFLFLSIASGCFLLTNFTITLVLESLLYLEASKQWHSSISFGSISKSELWQMSDTTFFRLSSGISFGIPDNSKLLCHLYCSDLAWLFSRLRIRSSSFAFIFFPTVRPLLIFSFVECSWDIVSFSFLIWLKRLDISESMITFPFKVIIFSTSSGFFMAFIADSDKVNKLVLSPILIWPNWQVHVGKWDLDFKIEFLRYWMYVLPLRMLVRTACLWDCSLSL